MTGDTALFVCHIAEGDINPAFADMMINFAAVTNSVYSFFRCALGEINLYSSLFPDLQAQIIGQLYIWSDPNGYQDHISFHPTLVSIQAETIVYSSFN